MKPLTEMLEDLKGFRSGLVKLHHSKENCNQLYDYISVIAAYIKFNEIGVLTHVNYAVQFELALANINPKLLYSIGGKRLTKKFRVPQYESYVILKFLIDFIEKKIISKKK